MIKNIKRRQKAKETKEEKQKLKSISVENLMGYDDIVCEFAQCTFNVFDGVVDFSWLFIWV